MIYRTLFQGSTFKFQGDDKVYTKVGEAYAIDMWGNELIPSLFDRVVPVRAKPSRFLDYHLEFINFQDGTFNTLLLRKAVEGKGLPSESYRELV